VRQEASAPRRASCRRRRARRRGGAGGASGSRYPGRHRLGIDSSPDARRMDDACGSLCARARPDCGDVRGPRRARTAATRRIAASGVRVNTLSM
jgi:hypothetical protein